MISLLAPFLAMGILCCATGCTSENVHNPANGKSLLADVPPLAWKNLAEKRVFFGHRSVGNNILQGIREILDENNQIKLIVVEASSPEKYTSPIFGHSAIGENGKPKSKVDAFSSVMNSGVGDVADIAFFKFCFADITADTDVEQIFRYYKDAVAQLKAKYPKTVFLHVTVPLTVTSTTVKTRLKKAIGMKRIWEYDHNIQRNLFNRLLRQEFADSGLLFDLEEAESTYPDGRRCSFSLHGQVYYALVPEYSDDGGHLNALGRRMVAEKLLLLLAELCS